MPLDPITAAIAKTVGSAFLSQLVGHFMPGGAEPAIEQRVGATSRLLPQLEAAARGAPTLAGERQIGRLGQEVTRFKQAYGAGARRAGISGTIPARAHIGRLEEARLGGVADILARQQESAQAQILGLGAAALPMQREIETERGAALQQSLRDLGQIFARARQEPERAKADTQRTEMLDAVRQAMMELFGGQMGGG